MARIRAHGAGHGATPPPASGPRRLLKVALAASLLLALIVGLSFAPFGGSTLASAAVQRAKSFIELIRERSPGRRIHGKLSFTKHRVASRPRLHERALPKVRFARQVPPPIAPPMPETPVGLFNLITTPPTPPGLESISFPPPAESVPSPPWILPPPGGLLPPTPTEVPPAPPPPSPVPEPGSWAMMLTGFALLGRRLRKRAGPVVSQAC